MLNIVKSTQDVTRRSEGYVHKILGEERYKLHKTSGELTIEMQKEAKDRKKN